MNSTRMLRCLLLLAVTSFSNAAYLIAQIDVPNVVFNEPSPREFEINDSLHFHLRSSIPVSQLRARVFWESKRELIDRARNAPPRSCVYYPSFVFGFESANGEVKFGWQFKDYSLRQIGDGALGNQVYTVVLERVSPSTVEQFNLYPKDVEHYFQSGQEIVLIAPPSLQSGAKATVERIKKIKNEEARTAIRNAPQRAHPSAEEACIVVNTHHTLTSAAELVVESCATLGQ